MLRAIWIPRKLLCHSVLGELRRNAVRLNYDHCASKEGIVRGDSILSSTMTISVHLDLLNYRDARFAKRSSREFARESLKYFPLIVIYASVISTRRLMSINGRQFGKNLGRGSTGSNFNVFKNTPLAQASKDPRIEGRLSRRACFTGLC